MGSTSPEGCEHDRSGPSRFFPVTGSRRAEAEAEDEEEEAAVFTTEGRRERSKKKKKKLRRFEWGGELSSETLFVPGLFLILLLSFSYLLEEQAKTVVSSVEKQAQKGAGRVGRGRKGMHGGRASTIDCLHSLSILPFTQRTPAAAAALLSAPPTPPAWTQRPSGRRRHGERCILGGAARWSRCRSFF